MLEITDRCNLNCSFCFNKLYLKQTNKRYELEKSEIKEIISRIKKSSVRIIRFTGGEPLLREDIFELMEFASKKNLKVWLNTNATLINRENVKKIVKYVDNILIPLNSFDAKSELSQTGADTFKTKLKNILLLKRNGIKYIRCGTVATRENILNLEKIYDLVKRLDVSDWELFRVIPLNNEENIINNDDIALLVEKLLKINKIGHKKYKIANAIPFCSYDPEKVRQVSLGSFADDGHNRFVINSGGDAKPMYYLLENIGNALIEDVTGIWNKKFMRDMRMLRYVPTACKGCIYVNGCKGGSRLASKVIGGDYRAFDYLAQPHRFCNLLFK